MGYILINFDGLTSEQGYQVKKRFEQFIQILLKEDKLPKDSFHACCNLLLPISEGYDYSDVKGETDFYD